MYPDGGVVSSSVARDKRQVRARIGRILRHCVPCILGELNHLLGGCDIGLRTNGKWGETDRS